ncbi:hypothetical protein FOTG_18964 [Fusarium oxysporum f. sp. vasinfectum 25433]|uniref:Methyltransferase n=1 Tax=Fusarium oxysporum f. sp. vasinfectum 25433 TaxID=1089449 RepID=X0KUQ9_FUSOX|nr:hypothetical protein FOTG_18964 [Fusarium oxysporum f. sp. vasinfectum 25433]
MAERFTVREETQPTGGPTMSAKVMPWISLTTYGHSPTTENYTLRLWKTTYRKFLTSGLELVRNGLPCVTARLPVLIYTAGIWAIDFADKFPGCEVIGTDISPIQPGWVPPNLKFEIEDCNQEWTFPSESFDYVHLRYLVGCIPDWTELFSQAYKTLKPGGWVESFEISPTAESDDGTVTYDSAMAQWGRIFVEASKKIGNSFTVVDDKVQRPALQEAGFVDIHEWEFKCPLNPWPKDPKLKEIGRFGEVFLTQDTEGFVTLAANLLGWSMEEVYVYIAKFRREVRNRKHHVYIRLRAVWARKPETKEEPTPA